MNVQLIREVAEFVKEAGELTTSLMLQTRSLTDQNTKLAAQVTELQKTASVKPESAAKAPDAGLLKTACDALVAAKMLKPDEVEQAAEKLQKDPDFVMKFLKAAADDVAALQKKATPMARVAAPAGHAPAEGPKRPSDEAYEKHFGGRV